MFPIVHVTRRCYTKIFMKLLVCFLVMLLADRQTNKDENSMCRIVDARARACVCLCVCVCV